MRALATIVGAATVLGLLAALGLANDVSSAKAAEAMATCMSVDRMPTNDKPKKLAKLAEGTAMAEAAVEADEQDARAHLALCCNIGKELEISGLSWRAFARLRRVQGEIDRAQELAPDDPDILVAKSEILRHTPGPLGGNKDLANKLLRHAIEVKPDHVAARLYLARAMADDREPGARAKAYEALALAKKYGAAHEQSEAQDLLASLRD